MIRVGMILETNCSSTCIELDGHDPKLESQEMARNRRPQRSADDVTRLACPDGHLVCKHPKHSFRISPLSFLFPSSFPPYSSRTMQ